MEINKKGLVYRAAYGYRDDWKQPNTTNVCNLFWSLLFGLLVWAFLGIVLGALYFLGFWVALRPSILKDDHTANLFTEIKHWPTIRGHRVLPVVVVAGAAAILLVVKLVPLAIRCVKFLFSVPAGRVHVHPYVFDGLLAAVLAALAVYGIVRVRRTEGYKLFKAFLRAKKERVCPIVVCR